VSREGGIKRKLQVWAANDIAPQVRLTRLNYVLWQGSGDKPVAAFNLIITLSRTPFRVACIKTHTVDVVGELFRISAHVHVCKARRKAVEMRLSIYIHARLGHSQSDYGLLVERTTDVESLRLSDDR